METKENQEVQEVEAIVAIEKDIPANDEKKQVTWNKLGDYAIADFPCGKQLHFDLRVFDTTIMKFYGVKQWSSDQVSAIKDEMEKIATMKENYADVAKSGIELTPTGKIRSLGKPRSNATGAAEAKRLASDMGAIAKEVSLQGLVMKQAMAKYPNQPEFTAEDEAKLAELFQEAARLSVKK